jgi:formate hydrogenlyase subunit 4
MIVSAALYGALNILIILLISPLFMTLIKKVKARSQRRSGPPLLQGYWNIIKLFRKEVIYSDYASIISHIAPYATFSLMIVAALMVPIIYLPQSELITSNIIIFLYLLTAGRLLLALLGLDAGSTFGGMGSSREMSLSAVIEPTTVVVFAAMAYVTGTLSITEIFRHAGTIPGISPTIILLSVSLFILIIVETGRIPVDNPETHLELTMIHEGMLLDTSGRNLALFELSHAIKQTLLMALLLNILIPFGMARELSAMALIGACILFIMKGAVLSVIIGLVESSVAKMRFFRIPNLFMMAFFFAVLTIFSEVML